MASVRGAPREAPPRRLDARQGACMGGLKALPGICDRSTRRQSAKIQTVNPGIHLSPPRYSLLCKRHVE
eukprot:2900916-Prymnesium_polylepis.1